MLSNVLYFAGVFALAWLVSGILLLALMFRIRSRDMRLLVANGGALLALEIFYRILDERFFFPRGEVIYLAAQLACLGSQWLLVVWAQKRPQQR